MKYGLKPVGMRTSAAPVCQAVSAIEPIDTNDRDKSHHWHVDYFREHAELVEIWFSHLDAEFEHQWAKSLAGLDCTDVPVPKFGSSDCSAGCPAHFFKFERRPTASLFRSITSGNQVPPVFVQSLKPDSKVSSNGAVWEQDYWQGATILEESRMQLYDSDQAIPDAQEIGKVGGNPVLSKLLDDYSDCWSLNRNDVLALVSFAAAVDQLIESLGYIAFEVLFLADQKQTRKHIMMISRKSIERQLERFEKVKNGEARSVTPVPGDKAPDTMTFAKFFTRLGRAKGSVFQTEIILKSGSSLSVDDRKTISSMLRGYHEELVQFRKQLKNIDQQPGSCKEHNPSKHRTKPATSVKQLKIQLASGLGMLRKNNRDLPRSSYDLRPTPEQYKRAMSEIEELRKLVVDLRQKLAVKS